METSKRRLVNNLFTIYKYISRSLKLKLFIIIILSIISGLSEILTLGSVIPFLSILLDINEAEKNIFAQYIISLFKYLNIGSENLIINFAIIFIILVLLSTILRITLVIIYTHWTHFLGIEIGSIMYSKAINQPFESYSNENSSNLLSALSTKLEGFTGEVFVSIPQMIVGIIISLAITASIFLITPVISLITFFIFGVSYFFIQLIYSKKIFENSFKIASTQNLLVKLIQESLGSIKNVILDKTQSLNHDFFVSYIKTLRVAQFQNSYISQYPKFLLEGIAILLIILLALYWSLNYQQTVEFIPELAVLALGGQKLLPLFQMIYNSINRLSTNSESLNEVSNFLDKKISKVNFDKEDVTFESKFEIQNLSFAYKNSPNIFDNINLTVKPGNIIGIYGKSGSGKTTFFDVLMGLLNPTSGNIFLDNKKLNKKNLFSWHKLIAHVPQNVFIYDDSIRNNILNNFQKDFNETKYEKILKQSDLYKYINNLSKKDLTMVGERGAQISGGQKQRIGIARALYKDAQIFFFDEITSSLDSETEKNIMNSINNINKLGKTIFIISHKLSILDICDQIYEFGNRNLKKIK